MPPNNVSAPTDDEITEAIKEILIDDLGLQKTLRDICKETRLASDNEQEISLDEADWIHLEVSIRNKYKILTPKPIVGETVAEVVVNVSDQIRSHYS